MRIGERDLAVVQVARCAAEFRVAGVREVLLVRIEKMYPQEETTLRHIVVLHERNHRVGQAARRVEEIDVRTRWRVALERRFEKPFEAIDPAELGREQKVRRGSGRAKACLVEPLGEKHVVCRGNGPRDDRCGASRTDSDLPSSAAGRSRCRSRSNRLARKRSTASRAHRCWARRFARSQEMRDPVEERPP